MYNTNYYEFAFNNKLMETKKLIRSDQYNIIN